jgi:hypothetical protein
MPTTSRSRAQALAAIALKLVEAVRRVFPVEGEFWPSAGEEELTAIRPFTDLLPAFAKAWWVPNDRGWKVIEPSPDDSPAIRELVQLLHDLFQHYGWGECGVYLTGILYRTRTSPTWSWPDAPEVPAALLARLVQTAQAVLAGTPPAPGPAFGGTNSSPNEPPVINAPPPPPPPAWTKKGPFGLTLNTNAHTVEKNGQHVEFGRSGRPWEVFVKLVERHPARYLTKELGHDVWNPDGRDVDPDDNLVQQAITTIRTLLNPLGVAVLHTRRLGYVLAELHPPAPPTAGKKQGKRKSGRTRKP